MKIETASCSACRENFPKAELDFLGRCLGCFRAYLDAPKSDEPRLFQSTGNPHNSKETKAYVERLERKRITPQGVDHNYVRRIYG